MTSTIVAYINDQLLANALADARFANAKLYPLAWPQQTVSGTQIESIPTYFENEKAIAIVPDDVAPVTIWHTNTGVTYQDLQQSLGGKSIFMRKISISMLVIMNLKKVRITPEDLELLIIESLPDSLPKATVEDLKLRSAFVRHQGSTFRTADLYQREFRSSTNKLKPHHAMFEVRYNLEITYLKGCLTVQCFCNN